MYTINKIIGGITYPYTVMWVGMVVSCLLLVVSRRVGSRKWGVVGKWLMGLSLAWLWLWSTPMMCRVVGGSLEAPYLVDGKVPRVEDLPNADVIELHGGSMGIATNLCSKGEMWTSADRVWMAAQLWKAGKAPIIVVSGPGCGQSTPGLLADFGVPTNALVIADSPRNTEEEAKWIGKYLGTERRSAELPAARVLVVTSAWHMRRTMMMYEKYAPNVEAIAAPCDFENSLRSHGFTWSDLIPSDEALVANRVSLHEWIGILGYKWFR